MILNENVELSLKGGVFKFQDNGNEVAYRVAGFSGKEVVKVNGRVVSESQNFRVLSEHTFTVGDVEYSILLKVKSLLKGDIECSLHKNQQFVKQYKLKYTKHSRSFLGRNLPLLFGGAAVGVAYSAKLISLWIAAIILVAVVLAIQRFNKGRWECEEKGV